MIDAMLLVKQLKATFFDNIVEENHLLAAVSPPTASVEHDYERLEFLGKFHRAFRAINRCSNSWICGVGDAFLKYAVSTYLFVTMPSDREGSLHQARQKIISNKALHLGALQAGIPPYIQSKPVVAKIWHPAGYSQINDGKSTVAAVEIKTEDDGDDGDVVSTLQSSVLMDVDTDVGHPPPPQDNEESKLRPRHFGGKRKKQQKEQSLQWLGDKVYYFPPYNSVGVLQKASTRRSPMLSRLSSELRFSPKNGMLP